MHTNLASCLMQGERQFTKDNVNLGGECCQEMPLIHASAHTQTHPDKPRHTQETHTHTWYKQAFPYHMHYTTLPTPVNFTSHTCSFIFLKHCVCTHAYIRCSTNTIRVFPTSSYTSLRLSALTK